MKNSIFFATQYSKNLLLSLVMFALVSTSAFAFQIKIYDPDDIGMRASVTAVKAEKRALHGLPNRSNSNNPQDCGTINIGNVQSKVGQSVPSNVTNVIEGIILQENDCK